MKYLKFYTNIICVKGANRSTICDLQREKSELIPNDLYFFIEKIKTKISVKEIFQYYGLENEIIIQEYIDFIIDNEYGFYVEDTEYDLFPDMNLKFNHSSKVTNSIIYSTKFDSNYFKKIVDNLEEISCKDIAFKFDKPLFEEDFENIEKLFKNTRVKSLEIICPFDELYTTDLISRISVGVLTKLVFFNAHNDKVENFNENHYFDLIYSILELKDFKFCGVVRINDFSANQSKVLESLNHNSCLHKKISIDKDGYIRNCPSMPQHFGNIKETTLEEALNHPDFKKYWNVNKDVIAVCKDCEFRHICTDCRAYTERTHFEEDIDLSKPLKCGYNPYTNEWAEWSTNSLKQSAIEYYDMQELVKKEA
jgi:SPASM domain peptide maturase of grasp-with-spasm system